MKTIVICEYDDCLYNRKNRCTCNVIEITKCYTTYGCEDYMKIPEILKEYIEKEEGK